MADGPPSDDHPDFPLTIRSTTSSGARVVNAIGELDLLTSPRLDSALVVTAAQALQRLVIDLSRVSFFGSSGLSALIRARDDTFRLGHRLYLVGALGNPHVAVPLEITGLTALFDHRASVADALDDLVPT